jgi:hypothetical protein
MNSGPISTPEPTCYGYCGSLGWSVEKHGRVTHKMACPHRCEPWCQTHPEGCPNECVPPMWRERAGKETLDAPAK